MARVDGFDSYAAVKILFCLLFKVIPAKVESIYIFARREIHLMGLDGVIAVREGEGASKILYQHSIITVIERIDHHTICARFQPIEFIAATGVC